MKLMSYTFFPHVPYTANDSIRTPTIAKKKKIHRVTPRARNDGMSTLQMAFRD